MGLLTLSSLAAPALRQRRLVVRAAMAVIGGGLVVAVYGIVARTLFGSLLFGKIAVPTVSPFGPFVSKNHFAGYVEMVALLAMGLALGFMEEAQRGREALSWVGSSRAGRIVTALGVAAALALAIPVSQSRGGVLSLVAGVAALFVLGTRRGEPGTLGKRRWVAGMALLFLIVAAQAVLPPEASQRIASLSSSSTDPSSAYRLGLWRDTLRAFAASPFVGQGLGAFQDALPRFKQGAGALRVEHAENDYLEFLVESGVVGALGLAAFLWLVGQGVPKATDHRGVEHGLRLGATAAGVALAVHSLVDFNLHIPASASLACFLLALASGRREPRSLDVRGASAVGVCGLLVLALASASVPSLRVATPRNPGVRRIQSERPSGQALRERTARPSPATTCRRRGVGLACVVEGERRRAGRRDVSGPLRSPT